MCSKLVGKMGEKSHPHLRFCMLAVAILKEL